MNFQEAFRLFMVINSAHSDDVSPISIYWDALTAERDGKITLVESDAIAVYWKTAIYECYHNSSNLGVSV